MGRIKHDDEMPLAEQVVQLRHDLRATRIIVLVLIVACLIGGTVLYSVITVRDSRRSETNQKFSDLSCLALTYTPSGSPFHERLAKLYPNCPKPKKAKLSPGPTITRSRTVTRTTTPDAAAPRATPTVVIPTGVSVPQPTPARAPNPSTTRTVVVSRTAVPPTASRSPPRPSTRPTPAPTKPPNILCSPLGLPVGLGC